MKYKWLFNILEKLPYGRYLVGGLFKYRIPKIPVEVFGINFSNPVGMGAGLDKNGEYFDILSQIGLSFAEIGPLNPTNVRDTIERIISKSTICVPAVNITRSPSSIEDSDVVKDIIDTFSLSYDFAEMFVLDCKDEIFDIELISEIVSQCLDLRITSDDYKPIILELNSSLTDEALMKILDLCMMSGIDGVVAEGVEKVSRIHSLTQGRFPIIACGNINTPQKALELLECGASLIALSDELYEKGPGYVKKILQYVLSARNQKTA